MQSPVILNNGDSEHRTIRNYFHQRLACHRAMNKNQTCVTVGGRYLQGNWPTKRELKKKKLILGTHVMLCVFFSLVLPKQNPEVPEVIFFVEKYYHVLKL